MARFEVATVSGHRGFDSHGSGISAHVIDRLYLVRVVATFQSETYLGRGKRLGVNGAPAAAQAYADELNRG